MKRIVDVADFVVTSNRNDLIITYALGSCLGVTAYDPLACVGGMIHCQLPLAPRNVEIRNKAQFVDTGVVQLIDAMLDLGCVLSRLRICVTGGAEVMENLKSFQIAQRNYTVLRKILWKNRLLITAEDVGGHQPRTMSLLVATGEVRLQSGSRHWKLYEPTKATRTPYSSSSAI